MQNLAPPRYDAAELERRYAVPPAATMGPGSVVLSMSGTDRTGMRAGLGIYTAVVFGLGLALGAWVVKK